MDGKFTPLKDLYPEFRREEVDRAIRIPVEGPVGPELDEILRVISDHPHVFLNTGHVSPDEAVRLVELAHEYGIGNVLVATAVTQVASTDQLRYMARRGSVHGIHPGRLHAHHVHPQDPLLRRAGIPRRTRR